MHTIIKNKSEKFKYFPPEIQIIQLDNEISLVLQSDDNLPPTFESSNQINHPEFFDNNNPYKTI